MARIPFLAAIIVAGLIVAACSNSQPRGEDSGEALEVAEATVDFWFERADNDPSDFVARARLGVALSLRARLTGDVSDYGGAAEHLEAARGMAPGDAGAAVQLGFVRAAMHDFSEALVLADDALALQPSNAAAHALRGDALLALGRYDEVEASFGRATSLAPGLETTARLAQFYAAVGDDDAASRHWDNALVSLAVAEPADAAWALTQAGRYSFSRGDLGLAERRFADALDAASGYAGATAGMADVLAARGDIPGAIAAYEALVLRRPAVEYVTALIDLYEAAGLRDLADQQRDVVLGIDELYRSAGINTDLAMARFHVQYGDAARGLELALASYAATLTGEAADILGAAYLRIGDADMAVRYAGEAVQLNPRSAIAHYNLARAELAAGNRQAAAIQAVTALAINPAFSTTGAPNAARLVSAHLLPVVLG